MTYLLPTVTQEALFDELEKIAESVEERHARQARARKKAKTIVALTASALVASKIIPIIHDFARREIAPGWNSLAPSTRRAILIPAVAATLVAGNHIHNKVTEAERNL